MSDLVTLTKSIQRAVGEEVDGVFGLRTAAAVLRELGQGKAEAKPTRQESIDFRTRTFIASLDTKAQSQFVDFILLAKATAATFGCDYIGISGTRSWEEQAELRKKHLAGGPVAAAAGASWHNYGTAMDFGVFRAKAYLDDSNPELASQVHAACAVHANACGLEWGGKWKGKSCDPPHYQINMGRSAPNADDRAKYKQKGTVL